MADRVTPYKAGGDISDRIDEIVITSPAFVHLEMMDRDRCWLGIGDTHFWVRAEKGKLLVGYTEGPIPPVSVEAAPPGNTDLRPDMCMECLDEHGEVDAPNGRWTCKKCARAMLDVVRK